MTASNDEGSVFSDEGPTSGGGSHSGGGAASGVLDRKRPRRMFTVDQANQALKFVSRVVDDIVACYAQLRELRARIEGNPASSQKRIDAEHDYEETMGLLSGYVDELHLAGVELKDFERGLIDFPCLHEGREVYLCWQRGEPKILAWHEIEGGFAGRRDIKELQTA